MSNLNVCLQRGSCLVVRAGMFDNLSQRLEGVWDTVRKDGKLTADNIKTPMREIRRALLEADVSPALHCHHNPALHCTARYRLCMPFSPSMHVRCSALTKWCLLPPSILPSYDKLQPWCLEVIRGLHGIIDPVPPQVLMQWILVIYNTRQLMEHFVAS